MKKNNGKIIIFYIILIVGILIATSTLMETGKTEELKYSDIVDMFENEQVSSYTIKEDNTLIINTHEGKEVTFKLRDLGLFEKDLKETVLEQKKNGIIKQFDYGPSGNQQRIATTRTFPKLI